MEVEKTAIRWKIGYWMTEKKIKRINFEEFIKICDCQGIELIKIHLDIPLEKQGPFHIILHKITDEMMRTKDGFVSQTHVELFQRFLELHLEIVVIDPVENVLRILYRHQQYQFAKDCDVVDPNYNFFIPSFAEMNTDNIDNNKQILKDNFIRYPIVCKPSFCGQPLPQDDSISNNQFIDPCEMAIVFNDSGLRDVAVPCVAQSFINHNARLFKIFVIGNRYFIIPRPSIKNLYADEVQKTIFFKSTDISKSCSASDLNMLDESELLLHPMIELNPKKLDNLVHGIQLKFGLELLGIDVIIENDSGRYAVIDINAFPGYDGVQEFFPALLQLLQDKLALIRQNQQNHLTTCSTLICQPHTQISTCCERLVIPGIPISSLDENKTPFPNRNIPKRIY